MKPTKLIFRVLYVDGTEEVIYKNSRATSQAGLLTVVDMWANRLRRQARIHKILVTVGEKGKRFNNDQLVR